LLAVAVAGCALNVHTVGTGMGGVTSSDGTISCGAAGTNCSKVTLQPANYTLQASASNGAIFTGWSGACSGISICSLTTDTSKTVFAHFQTPLAVGQNHACAIRLGALFCWGRASDGQLGRGTGLAGSEPPGSVLNLRIASLAIAAGGFHTCTIIGDGSVNCWGRGAEGQLGNGVSGGGVQANVPVIVTGTGPSRPVAIAAGGYHTCLLLTSGQVQCWGSNSNGQAGSGSPNAPQTVTIATVVPGISNAIGITAGAFHSCALLADNTARCWGRNGNGELGTGDGDSATPVVVSTPAGSGIQAVTDLRLVSAGVAVGALGLTQLGGYHTCGLKLDGTAVCWGFEGEVLGRGSPPGWDFFNGTTFWVLPNAFPVNPLAAPASTIASGGYHNCVVLTNGSMQCWGNGGSGQIGNNANASVGSPTTVTLPASRVGVGVAAGGFETCALLADPTATTNEVWCWGDDSFGQLGDTSFTAHWLPLRVNVP
jgi:alpha-tubulin suppressor-like RCC1 family protein